MEPNANGERDEAVSGYNLPVCQDEITRCAGLLRELAGLSVPAVPALNYCRHAIKVCEGRQRSSAALHCGVHDSGGWTVRKYDVTYYQATHVSGVTEKCNSGLFSATPSAVPV